MRLQRRPDLVEAEAYALRRYSTELEQRRQEILGE